MLIDLTTVHETDTHDFAGEASTIGLPPGVWPDQIPTAMGNGQPLKKLAVVRDRDSGDVVHVTYAQSLGLIRVRIFND